VLAISRAMPRLRYLIATLVIVLGVWFTSTFVPCANPPFPLASVQKSCGGESARH
jgi:hypothetical protein